MFPAFVVLKAEVDLDERAPLRSLWFADQMHARLGGRAVGLARIATDTGANDVLPRRRPSSVSRNHVVQVEIVPVKHFTAILASVPISLEDVVPGELDLLLGQAIKED